MSRRRSREYPVQAYIPRELVTQLDIEDAIDRSSLGTPRAKRLRKQGAGLVAAELTGMPEEQTDWEADE